MAVRIRLRKISMTSKSRYNFRIVVIDGHRARDGRVIEEIGYYGPAGKAPKLELKKDRYEYWVSKGALPTNTVLSLHKQIEKKKT